MEDYEDGFTPDAAKFTNELQTLLDDIKAKKLEVKVMPDGTWWIRDPAALLGQGVSAGKDHNRMTLGDRSR